MYIYIYIYMNLKEWFLPRRSWHESWHDSWLKIVFFAIYPFKLVKAILAGCKTIRSSTRIIHRRRAMLPRDLHINRKLYPYT